MLQGEQDKHVRDQAKSIFFVAAKQRRIKSQVLEEASWGSLPCYGESTLRSSFVSQGLITLLFFFKKNHLNSKVIQRSEPEESKLTKV